MRNIVVDKNQSRTIAKAVYGDIKSYCLEHADRYVPWLINEVRKSKGKPPLEPTKVMYCPCVNCGEWWWS